MKNFHEFSDHSHAHGPHGHGRHQSDGFGRHFDRRRPQMGFGGEFPGEGRDERPGFGPRAGGPGRGGGFRGRGPGWGGDERGGFGPGFEPGFGGPHGGRRGPGRGRKGDVRAAVIALLGEQPMNGYQLINAIADKSNGLWNPSAGSVYPALGLLEDEGLIAPLEADGKKLFQLTDAGKAYAEEKADQVKAPWDRVAGPHKAMLDLRPELHQLGVAVQQLAASGESEHVEAAREILVNARKNVYRLLAGDAPQA